jgi:hypothetical protein
VAPPKRKISEARRRLLKAERLLARFGKQYPRATAAWDKYDHWPAMIRRVVRWQEQGVEGKRLEYKVIGLMHWWQMLGLDVSASRVLVALEQRAGQKAKDDS